MQHNSKEKMNTTEKTTCTIEEIYQQLEETMAQLEAPFIEMGAGKYTIEQVNQVLLDTINKLPK